MSIMTCYCLGLAVVFYHEYQLTVMWSVKQYPVLAEVDETPSHMQPVVVDNLSR